MRIGRVRCPVCEEWIDKQLMKAHIIVDHKCYELYEAYTESERLTSSLAFVALIEMIGLVVILLLLANPEWRWLIVR